MPVLRLWALAWLVILVARARSCSARAGSAQQIRWKSIASALAQMSIFLGLRAGC